MKNIFVTLLYFAIVNMVIASDAVIWQQELDCEHNSTCRPGTLMVDKINNEVVILGTSENGNTRKADCWLWKIDPNGTVKNKRLLGLLSKDNMVAVRAVGIKATVEPNTGNILRLNTFAYDDARSISLSVTNKNIQTQTVKLAIRRKQSKTLMLNDMISYKHSNLLFVGHSSKDGIILRTDLDGNMVWEKSFDTGKIDTLNNLARDPDSSNFYVAGLSATASGKMSFADAATVCLLLYDNNGKLIASDFFEGGLAPWVPTFPKVIYLPCDVVLVAYDKSKKGVTTDLYVKAYTPELEPLYEKQILQTKEDGPPAYFDICMTSEDRFVLVVQVNYWDLRIYEYDVDGTILQTVKLDGEVGAGGVYVDYLAEKIFVASATKLKENEKEAKIKLIALKPYQTN